MVVWSSRSSLKADVKPRTLMTDSLVIKNFLRKVITVLPKIRFNFSVKVNGILSMEIFGAEKEPTLNLSNGIALVVNCQHYLSTPKFDTTELPCSRIHPVLGHPVMLFIPDDVVGMGLLGELTLTPAVALCPCPKVFSNQLNRISSVSIFLYGPSGLPLIFPNSEQPTTPVFKDASYFIDWKKHHLCMVPNWDLSLDRGSVLPDVSYQVESSEGEDQSQDMGPQGQTVLLFLFVDFHREFPGQKMELWGRYRRMGLPPWMCLNVKRINKRDLGTSLVVQWLRLDAPKLSSAIPGWGTRSHICQLRVHML
nr:PREDICTED: type 2 DNA topoisomerase 6 subunit B-like isoform X2 [Bos indicus]